MKINCAIIIDSIEDREKCLNKFQQINNKDFFSFNNKIKSSNVLKSKKNFFSELNLHYDKKPFFVLYPDEEIALWDEEEAFKSYYNLIVDKWIVKTKRSNAENPEVSKVFIKSSFKNVKKFEEDWQVLYSANSNYLAKLQEYIFVNDPQPNELFLIYEYVLETLKTKKHTNELVDFVRSMIEKYPTFVELINLWGDYLYESNMFLDAKSCYENAIKMSSQRQIYDFLPMIPSMHKKHPEKMLANIQRIVDKYDLYSK